MKFLGNWIQREVIMSEITQTRKNKGFLLHVDVRFYILDMSAPNQIITYVRLLIRDLAVWRESFKKKEIE